MAHTWGLLVGRRSARHAVLIVVMGLAMGGAVSAATVPAAHMTHGPAATLHHVRAPAVSAPSYPGDRIPTRRYNLTPPPLVYGFRPAAPSCAYEYNRWRLTGARTWRQRFFECRDG